MISERKPNYSPPIPEDLRETYENALGKVFRWQNGLFPADTQETDLQHVRSCLLILEDLSRHSLYLPQEIDFQIVSHMAYLHDAGEIIVGDLVIMRPNYDGKFQLRAERKERAAFRLLTKIIEDESLKAGARQLYSRFTTRRPEDKEAQLAYFVDKLAGTRFGLEHVFPGKRLKKSQRQMVVNKTAELFLEPVKILIKSLSPEAGTEIKSFMTNEFKRISKAGYSKEIKPLTLSLLH